MISAEPSLWNLTVEVFNGFNEWAFDAAILFLDTIYFIFGWMFDIYLSNPAFFIFLLVTIIAFRFRILGFDVIGNKKMEPKESKEKEFCKMCGVLLDNEDVYCAYCGEKR